MREHWQTGGIGDVNSNTRGSGARYNTGKMPVELIPLRIIADWLKHDGLATPAYVAALRALGRFQEGGGADALLDAIGLVGPAFDECAAVFDYGRKKYSKRGDCTCNAGDAARLKLNGSIYTDTREQTSASCSKDSANLATTKTSRSESQSIESGRPQTIENGSKTQPIGSAPVNLSGSVLQSESWTQNTKSNNDSTESSKSTDSRQSSTTPSWRQDAQSAGALTGCTSTTATTKATSEQRYAIPATLALDLSKGLTAGLSAHSTTCGVHQTPGHTGNWNWAKGMQWSVPLACAARHLLQMINHEENDAESTLPHRGHFLCNIVMLLTFIRTYPEGDDRPSQWLRDPAMAEHAAREEDARLVQQANSEAV